MMIAFEDRAELADIYEANLLFGYLSLIAETVFELTKLTYKLDTLDMELFDAGCYLSFFYC